VTTHQSAQLAATRDAVLDLHRTLLSAERIAWEAINGRVPGNADFLQLVLHDSWFAWLRPLTALVAAMDEALIDDVPEPELRAASMISETRRMLHPDENGDDFQQRYFEFVQRSPDVAVAHGVLMRKLASRAQ
jgi:hypothetical protein